MKSLADKINGFIKNYKKGHNLTDGDVNGYRQMYMACLKKFKRAGYYHLDLIEKTDTAQSKPLRDALLSATAEWESSRFDWEGFRSWIALVISVIAFAASFFR